MSVFRGLVRSQNYFQLHERAESDDRIQMNPCFAGKIEQAGLNNYRPDTEGRGEKCAQAGGQFGKMDRIVRSPGAGRIRPAVED